MPEEGVSSSKASSGRSSFSFKNLWNLKDKISGKNIKSVPNGTKQGNLTSLFIQSSIYTAQLLQLSHVNGCHL